MNSTQISIAEGIMWTAYENCGGPSTLVAWWLMAAYAYEHEADPILSDLCFDKMSIILGDKWAEVKHQHKKLIDGKSVAYTGSANTKPWRKMPQRIHWAVYALREQVEKLADEDDDSWLD